MDVFPALLEADVPFYSHEIDAYWNDIGNLEELRQGNLDALHGAVEVEPGAPEVREGVRAASPLNGAEVSGPALIGERVKIGSEVRIEGPAIVGDGCQVGDGAVIRDSILLEGTELPAAGILIGAIAAHATKA
jgi:NDP-sugar pyrophosphorylase family protein